MSPADRELRLSCGLQIQAAVEKWKYCWLFDVGNMRNAHLKTVRKLWKE
jgi:mRNA turnover protein 4